VIRWGTGPALLSRPELLTHDTRLPPERRHLSLSLVCLWDLLRQAEHLGIGLYRVASPLVPVATRADGLRFRAQLEQCQGMLAWLAGWLRERGMRLTAHPLLQIQLGSESEELARAGLEAAEAWADLWAALDDSGGSLAVVHVGGGTDAVVAAERFVKRAEGMSAEARSRLALENEDRGPTIGDTLWVAGRAGLPLVFDYHHWRCHNPERIAASEAVELALATWPPGARPKLHFSSPETGSGRRPPQPREHADYLDPFGYQDFARLLPPGRDYDVMLEAGAKDLALLKLRRDLQALAAEEGETYDRLGAGVPAAG